MLPLGMRLLQMSRSRSSTQRSEPDPQDVKTQTQARHLLELDLTAYSGLAFLRRIAAQYVQALQAMGCIIPAADLFAQGPRLPLPNRSRIQWRNFPLIITA